MDIKLEASENILVARLSGEIDHHTAQTARYVIDGTAEKRKPKTLVLDFTGVTFMDSSGIGLIMGRYKLMQLMGGRLRVVRMQPRIQTLVRLAGLDSLGIVG